MLKKFFSILVGIVFFCSACTVEGIPMQPEKSLLPPAISAAPTSSPQTTPSLVDEKAAELYREAEEAYAIGLEEETIACCYAALRESPKYRQPYFLLAEIYMRRGEKRSALQALEAGVRAQGGSGMTSSEELLRAWWEVMVSPGDTSQADLGEKELQALSNLAFLIASEPFCVASEKPKAELLDRARNYFGGVQFYSEEKRFNTAALLQTEREEGRYVQVKPESVIALVNSMYGIELIDPYESFAYDGAYRVTVDIDWEEDPFFACDGELYYFELNDHDGTAFFVERYALLGEGLYYVVLGQDWMSSAGYHLPAIVPDALHMIVERNEKSKYWFSAVSVVKDTGAFGEASTIFPNGWEMPEDMQEVSNADSGYPSYRTAKERAEDAERWEQAA